MNMQLSDMQEMAQADLIAIHAFWHDMVADSALAWNCVSDPGIIKMMVPHCKLLTINCPCPLLLTSTPSHLFPMKYIHIG